MSVRDFINNLQAGLYSRPVSQSARGQFCEEIKFPDEVLKDINTLDDFNKNASKLKSVRIRKVSGSGGFSSATKAKFKLSIPIKVNVSVLAQRRSPPVTTWTSIRQGLLPPRLVPITRPGPETTVPVYETIMVNSLTLYHPSPIRIENVQHDAVLSLNDPSDFKDNSAGPRNVILIPLKSSNMRDESVDFFNVIVKHLPSIQEPLDLGVYAETDIPTGNNWNIKQVFWLDPPSKTTNLSRVTDSFYTWTGTTDYRRVEKSQVMKGNQLEITYGWVPVGDPTRYYMLENPVSISANDLSILTRTLPPTAPENAIHFIPDPSSPLVPKVLYKRATGAAAKAACNTSGRAPRERMTNMSGSVSDMLTDEKGNPLLSKDSCDPFAMNAKNTSTSSAFTPMKMFNAFYKVLVVIAIALGAWIAMYLVANKDYDYKFKDFADDSGKVVGTLAKQASDRAKETAAAVAQMPKLPSVSQLMALRKGKVPEGLSVPGAAPPPTQ